jgi:hypothetical protein
MGVGGIYKMKTKVLSVFLVLILSIIPLNSAFASNINILQGLPTSTTTSSVIQGERLTDGDSNTYGQINANTTITFNLSSPATITGYRIDFYTSNTPISIKFYDLNNNLVYSSAQGGSVTLTNSIANVKKITFTNNYSSWQAYREINVYGSISIQYEEVTDVTSTSTDYSSMLTWANPTVSQFNGTKIYRDGVLITSLNKTITSFNDTKLKSGSIYSYKVTSLYTDGYETTGIPISIATSKLHDEISNLNASMTHHSADLVWSIPDNPFLMGFKIYRDGELIKTLDTTENYYLDDGLDNSTAYKYKVTSIYDDGFETPGVEKTFTTKEDPVVKKVANANAKVVSYKQINISWDLPNQSGFHHVNIYRAVKPKEQGFFEWLLGSIASADTTPTEIFETNGTYFNDLTVKPDTNYEYTLTTETTDGRVSDEVTVTAETPEEPTPVLKTDGNYTVNQEGSYVFKWTEPTVGKVKVLIDGKDYKVVDASLKQITIPKVDMKTNPWGDPSISMIPVGEFGTEGKEVFIGDNSFLKSLKLPFQSSDLLTTSMGILGLIAPIILLVLVIYYFKPIKRVIVNAALKIKERGLKT